MEVFLLFIFTLEPVLAYNPHPSLAFRFNGILAVTATVNCIALPVRCTLSIQCKWQLCLSFRVFHTKCELRIKYICDERERESSLGRAGALMTSSDKIAATTIHVICFIDYASLKTIYNLCENIRINELLRYIHFSFPQLL